MIQKTFPSNQADHPQKEPILEHGLDLFSRDGVKGFTVESLAKDLAMSKKTIYKFFPSKEVLLHKIFQHMTGILSDHFSRIMAKDINPLDKFIRIMDKVIIAISRISISRISELKIRFPQIWEELETFRLERRADFFQIMQEAQKQDLVRKELNLEITATLFMNIVNNVFQPEFFISNQLSPKEVIETFRNIFLRGIITQKGLKHIEDRL